MEIFYKIANSIRRIYWYIFRPHTEGVKCLIEYNGEYLLIQTSYSGNYWTLAGGGIKHGETAEQAARREVKEELGITLDAIKEIGHYESTIEYKKDTIYLFHAEVLEKVFKQNKLELANAQWFSKNALPENRSKALNQTIIMIDK